MICLVYLCSIKREKLLPQNPEEKTSETWHDFRENVRCVGYRRSNHQHRLTEIWFCDSEKVKTIDSISLLSKDFCPSQGKHAKA